MGAVLTVPFWLQQRLGRLGATPGAAAPQSAPGSSMGDEEIGADFGALGRGIGAGIGALGRGALGAFGAFSNDLSGADPGAALPPSPPPMASPIAPSPEFMGPMPEGGARSFDPPSESYADNSPMFSPEEERGARAAAAPPSVRAVRMPDGRTIFTNREDVSGTEIPMEEAARPYRVKPVEETMRGLISAAARSSDSNYTEDQPKSRYLTGPPTGIAARAYRPVSSVTGGGGVSNIEGTPQQQLALKLSDATGALALADTLQRTKVASMDPGEAALLGNPGVQQAAFISNMFLPRLEQARRTAMLKTQRVNQTISDPKQREMELRNIATEEASETSGLQNLMAIMMGLRPAQTF